MPTTHRNTHAQWLRRTSWVCAMLVTALGALACLSTGVETQTNGVGVLTDRARYAVGDVIVATVENRTDQTIYGWTGQSYCTILVVERRVDDAWQRAPGECQLEQPQMSVEIAPATQYTVELAPRLDNDPLLPPGEYRIQFTYNVGTSDGTQAHAYSKPFMITGQSGTAPTTPEESTEPAFSATEPSAVLTSTERAGLVAPVVEGVSVTTDRVSYEVGETVVAIVSNNLSETIYGWTGQTYCTILIVERRVDDAWQRAPGECQLEQPQMAVEIAPSTQHTVELSPQSDNDTQLPSGEYRIRFTHNIGAPDGAQAHAYSDAFVIGGRAARAPAAPPAPSPTLPEPGPTVTSTVTSGPAPPDIEGVSVTTDRTGYEVGETVVAIVSNNLTEGIYGTTGWTYCTIIVVEVRTGENWQMAPGECQSDAPRMPVEIAPQTQLTVPLQPQPGYPTLQQGQYRLRFSYSVGTESGVLETVFSDTFAIGPASGRPPSNLYLSLLQNGR